MVCRPAGQLKNTMDTTCFLTQSWRLWIVVTSMGIIYGGPNDIINFPGLDFHWLNPNPSAYIMGVYGHWVYVSPTLDDFLAQGI